MKIRTKIIIPPACFMLLLLLLLACFFIIQKKQQDELSLVISDLQQVNKLSARLMIDYLNNKSHLLRFRHDKLEAQLVTIAQTDNVIQSQLNNLIQRQDSTKKSKNSLAAIVNMHEAIQINKKELVNAVLLGDQPQIEAALDRFIIETNLMEVGLADFSADSFSQLESSLKNFKEQSIVYAVLAALTTALSVLLLLSILYFYNKKIIKPILDLTDSAWKIAQGYLEYKPQPITQNDEVGRLTLAFSVMTDNLISANENLEKKIKERTQELERSNGDLEQFAYIASHDLQEPLRMVASYNQLLAKRYQGQLDEKANKYIEYSVDGAKRMQAMINGLLEFSRAGSDELDVKVTDLSLQLDKVLHDLGGKIKENDADIQRMPLPSLMVNAQQINRVFQNLISNAIKFRNGESVKIDISVKQGEKESVFCVQDNGVGIDSISFERIFNLFERVHDRQHYPGNGIGLAVSKRLVENHGGRIWLESTVGEGAAFYFSLPANEAIIDEGDEDNKCDSSDKNIVDLESEEAEKESTCQRF
ncbi:MAG: ATP-binding protein [Bermanella sp.]